MFFRYSKPLPPGPFNELLLVGFWLTAVFLLLILEYFDQSLTIVPPEGISLPRVRGAYYLHECDPFDPDRIVLNVTREGKMSHYYVPCTDKDVFDLLSAADPPPWRVPGEIRVLSTIPVYVIVPPDPEADDAPRESTSGLRNRKVLINADKNVPFGVIRKILQGCADARVRLWDVSFGTEDGPIMHYEGDEMLDLEP